MPKTDKKTRGRTEITQSAKANPSRSKTRPQVEQVRMVDVNRGQTPGGGGKQVAKLSDIPVGGSISATLDGKPIILAQPSTGKVVAFTAICTHQGCTVNPDGAVLRCPCHASTYDAFTGENTGGPARSPLAAIPVTVSGGAVLASA